MSKKKKKIIVEKIITVIYVGNIPRGLVQKMTGEEKYFT